MTAIIPKTFAENDRLGNNSKNYIWSCSLV